jgi:hypothetical protein
MSVQRYTYQRDVHGLIPRLIHDLVEVTIVHNNNPSDERQPEYNGTVSQR